MSNRFPPSVVDEGHQDFPLLARLRDGINQKAGGADRLRTVLPTLLSDAVDFVLDPAKTGRTTIEELDKVEKTFIGLKVEHFLRNLLDAPKGLKRDLEIDKNDIDVKNTVGTTVSIRPGPQANSTKW